MYDPLYIIENTDAVPQYLSPVISASNLASFIEWFRNQGGDPAELALPAPLEVFTVPTREQWFTYKEHNRLQYSIIERIPDFSLHTYFAMGLAIADNKRVGIHRVILNMTREEDLLPMLIRISRSFITYVTLELIEYRAGFCRLRYHTDPLINKFSLGGLAHNITGMLCAAITFRMKSPCTYTIRSSQNLLRNIATTIYHRHSLEYEEDDETVRLNGRLVGAKQTDGSILMLDHVDSNGIRLLDRGTIFNAPYSEVDIAWHPPPDAARQQSPVRSYLDGPGTEGTPDELARDLEARLYDEQQLYFELYRTRQGASGIVDGGSNVDPFWQAMSDAGLTTREKDIAQLVRQGLSRKEIASACGIAVATTKRHLESLYTKLGIHDRVELVLRYTVPTVGSPGVTPKDRDDSTDLQDHRPAVTNKSTIDPKR